MIYKLMWFSALLVGIANAIFAVTDSSMSCAAAAVACGLACGLTYGGLREGR